MHVFKSLRDDFYKITKKVVDEIVIEQFCSSSQKRINYQEMILKAISAEMNFKKSDTKEELDKITEIVLARIEEIFDQNDIFWHSENIKMANIVYAVTKKELIARGYIIKEGTIYKDDKKIAIFRVTKNEKVFIIDSETSFIPKTLDLKTSVRELGFRGRLPGGLEINNIFTIGDILNRWKNNHIRNFKGMEGLSDASYRQLTYFLEKNKYIDERGKIIDYQKNN